MNWLLLKQNCEHHWDQTFLVVVAFCVKKWKSLHSLLAPEFRPELFEFFVFEFFIFNIFQRDFGTGFFFFVHVFFFARCKNNKSKIIHHFIHTYGLVIRE